MVKAKRELESNLKLADAVLLMLDARAPVSTRHPELEAILQQRNTPFVLVLNKADLAEAAQTEAWRARRLTPGRRRRARRWRPMRAHSNIAGAGEAWPDAPRHRRA